MAELGGVTDVLGIDWLGRWQALVEERRRRIEALGSQGPQGQNFWDRRAAQFRRMTEQHHADHDLLVAMLRDAVHGGTFLDVGAGPGRFLLPVAGHASHVTAVEPSAGMREQLAERLRATGVGNVTIVPEEWQRADVPPHDIVLCAHVLYPIVDIAPFVRKLVAAARRAWFITIRVDPIGAEVDPLWQPVWGIDRPAEPTFLDLYPLLFSLGLRPNVRIRSLGQDHGVDTLEQALESARGRLFVPPDDRRPDPVIMAYLREHMDQVDGRYYWRLRREEAIIWDETAGG